MSTAIATQNLIDFNVSASLAVAVINPLAMQLDAALFGSLGLGALQANFQAQLQAALKCSFDIGLNITNPLIGFQLALAGIAGLQAQITAALSGAIPAISIDATGQLAANLALVGVLELQIGGLQALISGMLQLKMPAMQLAADFAAKLNAGPVTVLAWENEDKAAVATLLNGLTAYTGNTYGVLVITQAPQAWAGLKFFFNTGL